MRRFSKNEWSKITALLWLTLALIYLGGLGIYTVSRRPLHESFWEVMLLNMLPLFLPMLTAIFDVLSTALLSMPSITADA